MWGGRCPGGTCTNTEMTNEFLGIQEFGESTHSIPMHVGLNVQTIIAFTVTLQLRVTWGRICNVFPHISVWELTSTNRHSWIIICDVSVKHKDWVIVYLGWNVVCQRFLCSIIIFFVTFYFQKEETKTYIGNRVFLKEGSEETKMLQYFTDF